MNTMWLFLDNMHYIGYYVIVSWQCEYYVVVSLQYALYWVCPLQVGVVECGYYVMRYMRDIITNGSIVVTDLIDTRTLYSELELDEVRMELADFLVATCEMVITKFFLG
ncbi:hypothetical protein IC582_028300 [Cucumis melo]